MFGKSHHYKLLFMFAGKHERSAVGVGIKEPLPSWTSKAVLRAQHRSDSGFIYRTTRSRRTGCSRVIFHWYHLYLAVIISDKGGNEVSWLWADQLHMPALLGSHFIQFTQFRKLMSRIWEMFDSDRDSEDGAALFMGIFLHTSCFFRLNSRLCCPPCCIKLCTSVFKDP